MAEPNSYLLGDRNTIRMLGGLRHRGHYYHRGHEVVVNKETAERILEKELGELISIEFDKGLKMQGQSISFRSRK